LRVLSSTRARAHSPGPLLFDAKDAPYYAPGVKAVLAIFCVLIGIIGGQVILLWLFNKQRQRQREAHGKPKYIHDTSMENKYTTYGSDEHDATIGQNGESPAHIYEYEGLAADAVALLDMTDIKNDEFVYVY
jgi:hypothetical protein